MRKLLLILACCLPVSGILAQTKGTNTIGLGLNFVKFEQKASNQGNEFKSEIINNSVNLGYGYFIKENKRIGIDLFYGVNNSKSTSSNEFDSKLYGFNLNYQQYYPLIKKFYAFAGARGGYNHTKGTSTYPGNPDIQESINNSYSVGGYGGLTFFLSKRLAFETQLLSSDIVYSKNKNIGTSTQTESSAENTYTSFNLNTSGAISGLGFKIYFLF